MTDHHTQRVRSIVDRVTPTWFGGTDVRTLKLEVEKSPVPHRVRLVARYVWLDNYADTIADRTFRMTNDELRYDAPEREIVRAVRNLLGIILLHELDETLLFDGVRFEEPHAGGNHVVVCFCPEPDCECKWKDAAA